MKRLKKILLVGAGVILMLLLFSQILPSTYHVERRILVAARPAAIHGWLADLKKWPAWSAWTTNKDATLVYAYEGAETGVGAISKWDSKKLGEGSMKLTESDPTQGVKFDLSFEHGRYLSTGALRLEPDGEGTMVTWTMDGEVSHHPLDRYFSLLMSPMMGGDLEEGLANLKKRAEGR